MLDAAASSITRFISDSLKTDSLESSLEARCICKVPEGVVAPSNLLVEMTKYLSTRKSQLQGSWSHNWLRTIVVPRSDSSTDEALR